MRGNSVGSTIRRGGVLLEDPQARVGVEADPSSDFRSRPCSIDYVPNISVGQNLHGAPYWREALQAYTVADRTPDGVAPQSATLTA